MLAHLPRQPLDSSPVPLSTRNTDSSLFTHTDGVHKQTCHSQSNSTTSVRSQPLDVHIFSQQHALANSSDPFADPLCIHGDAALLLSAGSSCIQAVRCEIFTPMSIIFGPWSLGRCDRTQHRLSPFQSNVLVTLPNTWRNVGNPQENHRKSTHDILHTQPLKDNKTCLENAENTQALQHITIHTRHRVTPVQ